MLHLQYLFSLFSPLRREPDPKMASYIFLLKPTKVVEGAITRSRIEFSTMGWLEILGHVGADEERLLDLDRCFVDHVVHVRAVGVGNKTGHEKVESESETQVGVEDCRAGYVHREWDPHSTEFCVQLKADSANHCVPASPRLRLRLVNWTGINSSSSDMVCIDADYDEAWLYRTTTSTYVPVYEFNVPRGTPPAQRLTALDCAILASVITERAKNYSRLCHMSMWFATIFFLTANHICVERGYPPQITAKHLNIAGRYGKLPLIDATTGCLLFSKDSGGFDDVKKAMRKGMIKDGVSSKDVEQFLTLLDNDMEAWPRDDMASGDPVQQIFIQFQARRSQIRERIKEDVDAARLERTAPQREAERETTRRVNEALAERAEVIREALKRAEEEFRQAMAEADLRAEVIREVLAEDRKRADESSRSTSGEKHSVGIGTFR
ncbi:hypothetical protein B0H11DRAFT_1959891 [Mycena galericulata]|nr:hypothetical protein B0H11DRAFT_1959891 [Mycena galericulata]